jgi:Uma2 family endonuclease
MRRAFTRADYEAMPQDWRGELIDGELVMSPPPVAYHQHLLLKLANLLCAHVGLDRVLISPVAVPVNDRNVYEPDLLVLPEGVRASGPDWKPPLPLWVVEVLSPSTAAYDRDVKFPALGEIGVKEGWLVAPRAREIEVFNLETGVHALHGMGDAVRSISVPGFRVRVDEFFGPAPAATGV